MTTIQALAFGELTTPSWGAAWLPAGGDTALVACRAGAATGVMAGRPRDSVDDAGPWGIEGDELSLLLRPAGPMARGSVGNGASGSVDHLCEVTGRAMLGGAEHEIECLGWRGRFDADFELGVVDSFRQAAGWFDAADGFSLSAYRPQKSRGHDADYVAAAVLEAEPAPRIDDPRLSTTYDAAGLPTRVGLELWFEPSGPEEDSDDDDDRPLTRRAAAEAIGAGIDWEVEGFKLHAALLHWHSRGHDGAGVYLLGQRA